MTEPGFAHEGPAAETDLPSGRIVDDLAAEGRPVPRRNAGALRLPRDDGAFEPDASGYPDPAAERSVPSVEGHLDVRGELPPPDLAVETDRNRRSRRELAPCFRRGAEEAWTTSRRVAASTRIADPGAQEGFRLSPESAVRPGLSRGGFDRLLVPRDPIERARPARLLARRAAARVTARPRSG